MGTLIEDLEAAAQIADLNAQECRRISLESGSEEACRTFAARLREHASRLRSEMERWNSPKGNIGVAAILEIINGGPLK